MAETEVPLHYVCTHEEARALAASRDRFWVCNCGCREGGNGCKRSREDVCLEFSPVTEASGSGWREISRKEAEEIFREAEDKRLVTRPFRKADDRTATDGICFCCDDCCGYFLNREERCDRGAFVEETDLSLCTDCLACVAPCHFEARKIKNGRLSLNRDECYGCGLCVEACPSGGITMVRRD